MQDFRVITWEDTKSRHLSSFGKALAWGIQVDNALEPLRMWVAWVGEQELAT